MPDSDVFTSDVDQVSDLTITVACECYSSLSVIRDVLVRQSELNGALAWCTPVTPTPDNWKREAELVLVVSDKANLSRAIERSSSYKQQGQAACLLYLQDVAGDSSEAIPGLTLSSKNLDADLARLSKALFAPVTPQGLVCIDWADTRHILLLDGQILIEEASGSQPVDVIDAVVARLQARASGRPILGMQASILCRQDKLAMSHVHHLLSACKEVASEDATLIVGAPFLDWPESDHYEVRLIASVACAELRGSC